MNLWLFEEVADWDSDTLMSQLLSMHSSLASFKLLGEIHVGRLRQQDGDGSKIAEKGRLELLPIRH